MTTLMAGLTTSASAGKPNHRRPHVRVIAPGVALTTFADRRLPIRAFVMWIDPSQGASIEMALARGSLGELERTSEMARDHGAIAAINGDLGSRARRPVHPFALNGELVQTSPVLGAMFSISGDGAMRIGRPTESASVTELDSGQTLPLAGWNQGRPGVGELTAYTDEGGSLESPRPFTCSARLAPAGPSAPTDTGTARTYTVDQAGCFSNRLRTDGGIVISAVPTTDEATFIRSLSQGESLRIDWSLGWPGVIDAIGGSHLLVQNGRIALGACSGGICAPNPRTGIGLTADGRIALVVIDGRQHISAGLSLQAFASFFMRLGVVSAMNLDGGGSSVMVVKGQVVNQPSDGFERSVTNSLLVRLGD
jgi:hypothetical protein